MSFFENCHPYVEALFHSMLSEQSMEKIKKGDHNGDWKFISDSLNCYYPDIQKIYRIEDDTDRAYILKTYDKLIIAISGTKSPQGWLRNLKCLNSGGWHYGFKRSFQNSILQPMVEAVRGWNGPIKIYGHSAGPAIGLNADYYLREKFKSDVELIGFCAPQAVDKNGKAQCKRAKVRATFIDVGLRDQVDDISKVANRISHGAIGGVDYGYQVDLPDMGDPDINKIELIDDYFFGHAPSYVCKCVKQLFQNWKKPQDAAIDEISKFAVR